MNEKALRRKSIATCYRHCMRLHRVMLVHREVGGGFPHRNDGPCDCVPFVALPFEFPTFRDLFAALDSHERLH